MKKQTGKRLGAGLLSTVLLANAAFPVWADSENEPYTVPKDVSITISADKEYSVAQLKDSLVEFDEIEYLVATYNNTVVSNDFTYISLRDAFEAAEEADTLSSPTGAYADSDEATEQAIEIINTQIKQTNQSIRELEQQMSTMTDEAQKQAAQNQVSVLQNTVAALQTQKGSMTTVKEVNTTLSEMMSSMTNGSGMSSADLRNYYFQFSQAEATIAKTAQSMYPTYYQLIYNLEQLQANLALAETSYQGALVQQQLGMCTENDVADALYNVTSIKNSIASLENQVVVVKQEFCKLIGKSFNAEVEFGELPEVDYDYIASINVYEDIEVALNHNYTVLSKQNAMTNYGPSTAYESQQSDLFSLNAAREDVRSAVNQAYLDIQAAKSEVDMANEKLANAQRSMDLAELKYNLGLISKLEYEQQKVSYVAEEVSCKTAESKLLDAINTYKWSLRGL